MKQALTYTLAGLALLASPAAAESPTAERAAILATIGRMEAAWNRGDFARARALAGLAGGLRFQALMLTVPLLIWEALRRPPGEPARRTSACAPRPR